MRIAHVINPVKVKEPSDLFLAQPVTFESMLKAKKYSEVMEGPLVDLFAISYLEDREIVPPEFIRLPDLENSVLNLSNFTKQKKLPLISDLLMPFASMTKYDYVIYTNVDIGLMPFFYNYIQESINNGIDSLIINRRVVQSTDVFTLNSFYSQIGGKHPGYDCFVFKREILKECFFGNACIGANFIGRVMYLNLFSLSNKLDIVKEDHLTFHIGEDGDWLSGNYSDFDEFNRNETMKVIDHFKNVFKSDDEKLLEYEKISEFVMSWDLKKQSLHTKKVQKDFKIEKKGVIGRIFKKLGKK